MSFQYGSRTLWIDDLGDPQPQMIDLCARHADRLCPPRGWTGQDRRQGLRPAVARAAS